MKIVVYSRVSTEKQTLAQQERTVNEWLSVHGLQATSEIADEGVSGGVSYKERNLGKVVLPMLERGDMLIVSELSRIGRSMSDINKFVSDEMKPRGIRLVIVQMGLDLDCSQLKAIDEMILFAFGFAAQMEKELIQERTQSAIDVRKKMIEESGSFVSKKGNVCTRLGSPTHEALCRAANASRVARRIRARQDANNIAIWNTIQEVSQGRVPQYDDLCRIVVSLNNQNLRTQKGLNFNISRARGCYYSLREIFKEQPLEAV